MFYKYNTLFLQKLSSPFVYRLLRAKESLVVKTFGTETKLFCKNMR